MVAQLDADYIRTRPSKALSRLVSHLLFQGRPLTTRWQWINRVLFAHFAFARRLPQLKTVEKPIFILGSGRSGTTILGKVVSIHPHVGFLNEPKALWHAVYPKEDLIGSYSRGAACYRLGAEDVDPQVRRAAHRLYGYYLAMTRSKRVLDKYPEMIFRVSFLQAIFPDAKMVLLIRNGWDAVRSIDAWSPRHGQVVGGEVHDWWGANNRKWRLLLEDVVATDRALAGLVTEIAAFSQSRDMAAVEWIATMREGLRLMRSMPEVIHQVRYEELTSFPRQTLTNLLGFCELSEDTVLLDYAQRVLVPARPKEPFVVSSAIEALFHETMRSLDYAV